MERNTYTGEPIIFDWARVAQFGILADDKQKLSPAAVDMTNTIDKWLQANADFQDAIVQAQTALEDKYGSPISELEASAAKFLKSKQLLEEIEKTTELKVETVNHWIIKIINTQSATGPHHKKALDEILNILTAEQLKQANEIINKFARVITPGTALTVEHASVHTAGFFDTVIGWLSSLLNGIKTFYDRAISGLTTIAEDQKAVPEEGDVQLYVAPEVYNQLLMTTSAAKLASNDARVVLHYGETEVFINQQDIKKGLKAMASFLEKNGVHAGQVTFDLAVTNPKISSNIIGADVEYGGIKFASMLSINQPYDVVVPGTFMMPVMAEIKEFNEFVGKQVIASLKDGTFEDHGYGIISSASGIRPLFYHSIKHADVDLLHLFQDLTEVGFNIPEKLNVMVDAVGPNDGGIQLVFETERMPDSTGFELGEPWACDHCGKTIVPETLELVEGAWHHAPCRDKGPVSTPNPMRQQQDYGRSAAKTADLYPPMWIKPEDISDWNEAVRMAEEQGAEGNYAKAIVLFRKLRKDKYPSLKVKNIVPVYEQEGIVPEAAKKSTTLLPPAVEAVLHALYSKKLGIEPEGDILKDEFKKAFSEELSSEEDWDKIIKQIELDLPDSKDELYNWIKKLIKEDLSLVDPAAQDSGFVDQQIAPVLRRLGYLGYDNSFLAPIKQWEISIFLELEKAIQEQISDIEIDISDEDFESLKAYIEEAVKEGVDQQEALVDASLKFKIPYLEFRQDLIADLTAKEE